MFSACTYTAIAALTVLALTAADPADGATAPQPVAGQYEAHPGVVVESRGHELRAGRGSFCWYVQLDDGTGRGICADTGREPSTTDQLPVRGKRIVHIDLGRPALRLTAGISGKRLRGPRRGDPSGRLWALRLPRRLPPKSVLLLFASFTQGNVPYGASLRRAKP